MSNTFKTEESFATSTFKRADTVKMYKEDTQIEYPCLVLTCDKLEQFRVSALKGVMNNKSLIVKDGTFSVYVALSGQHVKIGEMDDTRLKFILGNKVFDVFAKRFYRTKDVIFEGEMLYALCKTSSVNRG